MSTESSPKPALRIGVVLGTRPEVIKLAPVIQALKTVAELEPVVISTGQHPQLVREMLAHFDLAADVELTALRPGGALSELAGDTIRLLGRVYVSRELDLVLVQGDTTTAFAGAVAAFYTCVPVVHLEAGLRSGTPSEPYPEEVNRRLITQIAELHLAPTRHAAEALHSEGVAPEMVALVGNTGIDALLRTAEAARPYTGPDRAALQQIPETAKVILVTAHRRESWGGGIRRITEGIAAAIAAHPQTVAVFPVHPNPQVRESVRAQLGDRERVILTEPLPYTDLVRLLQRADIVVTDSGGIQEEACTLGKPTLVTREVTERTEGIEAGGLRLVGTEPALISAEIARLLSDPCAYAQLVCTSLPFGDGKAARRSVEAIRVFAVRNRLAQPAGGRK